MKSSLFKLISFLQEKRWFKASGLIKMDVKTTLKVYFTRKLGVFHLVNKSLRVKLDQICKLIVRHGLLNSIGLGFWCLETQNKLNQFMQLE
ncbi:hypothetical protein ACFXTH_000279 [Malus domestica]